MPDSTGRGTVRGRAVRRQVISLFSDSELANIKEGKESIIKLRGAIRAEDLSEVAGKLVSNFWEVVAKPSSRMNDRVRNPNLKRRFILLELFEIL